MIFISLLILAAFSIAAVAAYFSIYGLAAIFSGWFWEVIAMGVVLEYGKLIMASYIYRYKDSITRKFKMYGISAVIVLMIITSTGIFGFLSQGYQQDTLSLKQQEQRITLIETERTELEKFKEERIARKKQIDDDIASLPNNYITARQRLLKSFGPELEELKKDIAEYTKQINEKTIQLSEIKQEKLINEVHIGPIIFISKAFSADTDTATKWLIIMIIFVFDPLAVMLTLGANHALILREEKAHKREKKVESARSIDKPSEVIINDKEVHEIIHHESDLVKEMVNVDVTDPSVEKLQEIAKVLKNMNTDGKKSYLKIYQEK
jgi:cell division protein FtsB